MQSMSKTINAPEWMERFELYMYTDQAKVLTFGPTLCNQSDWLGKVILDLAELDKDRPYRLKKTLEDCGDACIELLITITGCQQQQASDQAMNNWNESYKQMCSRYVSLVLFVPQI